MARNRETKIELTAYDDLFQTDESRAEAALSKIRDIPIIWVVAGVIFPAVIAITNAFEKKSK